MASQRFIFILDVAREGMNRSEAPTSEAARRGTIFRRLEDEVELPVEKSCGKKCCRGDMFKGLGHEGDDAVTMGVGRKKEASRGIPGGGISRAGAEAADEVDDGAVGGMEVFANPVEMGEGRASLLA